MSSDEDEMKRPENLLTKRGAAVRVLLPAGWIELNRPEGNALSLGGEDRDEADGEGVLRVDHAVRVLVEVGLI